MRSLTKMTAAELLHSARDQADIAKVLAGEDEAAPVGALAAAVDRLADALEQLLEERGTVER